MIDFLASDVPTERTVLACSERAQALPRQVIGQVTVHLPIPHVVLPSSTYACF